MMACAVSIGALVAGVVGGFPPPDPFLTSGTINLRAISDGAEVEGQFFLMSGSINTEQVYNYYTTRSDGGIVRGSIPANRTVIYETTEGDPRIEVTGETCNGVDLKLEWYGITGWNCTTDLEHYIVYVPPGSVTEGINLDNE